MQYELFYVIGSSKEAEEDAIKKSVDEIVENAEGKFLEDKVTFKRKLAYEIKHETQGVYIARRFEIDDNEKLAEMNRNLNLNDNILRFIIVKADELPNLNPQREEPTGRVEKKEKKAEVKKEEKPVIKTAIEEELVVEKKSTSTTPSADEAEVSANEKGPEKKEEELPAKKEKEKDELSEEDIDKKLEEILKI